MFGNTSIRTILQIFSISTFGCALMVGYGCSRPLLYPPSCNLSPVLTAMYPRQIDTLAGCPRDNVYVENGINKGDDDNSGINTLTPVIIVFADVWVRNTCFLTRLLRFVF